MKNETLLNAIGQIDDELITDARIDMRPSRLLGWFRWVAAAACCGLLLTGLVGVVMWEDNPPDSVDPTDIQIFATEELLPTESGLPCEPMDGDINLYSFAQLEEMRMMAHTADENALAQYLAGIAGEGALSRQDLIRFLEVVGSVPVVQLLEGTVSFISYKTGFSEDTGEYYDILFLSQRDKNGQWLRMEYLFGVEDVSEKLEHIQGAELIKPPTPSSEVELVPSVGLLKPHLAEKKPHSSGTGDTVTWHLSTGRIYIRAVYYTKDASEIDVWQMFQDCSWVSIWDLAAKEAGGAK